MPLHLGPALGASSAAEGHAQDQDAATQIVRQWQTAARGTGHNTQTQTITPEQCCLRQHMSHQMTVSQQILTEH